MNGYAKYKEKSIYSMSSIELLLMLYDEAVKRLKKAELALDEKEYELFEDSIIRTSKIVQYLIDILDLRQPVSHDLRRIYNYLIYDISIVKAGRERRRDEIGRISHILTELRDAFDQASRKCGDMHMTQQKSVLG